MVDFPPKIPIPDFKLKLPPPVLSLFKECTPKILVYCDGFLKFDDSDFGLSDFINTLKNTTIHGMPPIVKTAHRATNPMAGVDLPNFEFQPGTLSKNKYDVLFLFGADSSGDLPADERAVITQFMDDGGGVFATGDHANLGLRLCGNIPRVRDMRRWAGPSAGGTDRLSTNDPGIDNAFQFDDQADAVPQKIYPAYKGTMASSEPHFLLQHPTKNIIEVLPDHPHESECTIPASLADVSEWPKDSFGVSVSPEIVALSVSYGGGFPGKQPISVPRSFGAIAAYDGHLANVGRISTDATWHHFININLIDTVGGTSTPGLIANPDAYERVSTYFGNIATWLMPKNTRRCLRWPFLITIREFYPIAEFTIDLPDEPDIQTLIELGRQAKLTLSRFVAPGLIREITNDLFELHSADLAKQIAQLYQETDSIEQQIGQQMAPLGLLEQVALGAMAHTVAKVMPPNSDLETIYKKVEGISGLDEIAQRSIQKGLRQLAVTINEGKTRLDIILDKC